MNLKLVFLRVERDGKQHAQNEMRYPQQAESSAIRFPINRRSFL
jgi:hypothetical protein